MKLKRIAAALFALTAWGTLMTPTSFAAPQVAAAPGAMITVTGTGEVTVTPDVARITVGVQTRGKESTAVAAENAQKIDAVIKAVKALGVADKDIQTENYNLNPQFDYQKQPPTLTGYEVNNSVRVTVRKISDAGKVLDAALKAGGNVAGGIAFEVSNPEKAQDEALAKAVADALRKATLMAKAAGMTSKPRLVMLSEGIVNNRQPIMPMARMAMAEMAASAPTPVQPGETKITATVTVQYSVE